MRRGQKAIVWTIVATMAAITLFQWIGLFRDEEQPADAKRMLYEVSMFQVELLGGFVGDAAEAATTSELNSLKQAAYSVEYAHSRLVRAWGSEMPEMRAASGLMEYIVRLQIGGDRSLKPEEAELFGRAASVYGELQAAYAAMLTPDGKLIGTEIDRLREADGAITEAISSYMK
ncbi:hypothetical protein MO973_25550 [Paenibacillus sp. TRM 82003]|nr:hypothetical protein [Paenibacillus sp. TRM 82003]